MPHNSQTSFAAAATFFRAFQVRRCPCCCCTVVVVVNTAVATVVVDTVPAA